MGDNSVSGSSRAGHEGVERPSGAQNTRQSPRQSGQSGMPERLARRQHRESAKVCSPYLVAGLALAVLFLGFGLTGAIFESYYDTNSRLLVIAPLCLVAGLIATCRFIYKKFKFLKQSDDFEQCISDLNSSSGTQRTSVSDAGYQQVGNLSKFYL